MPLLPLSSPGDAPLDAWSFVHFGSGLALGVLTQSWLLALGLLLGYEVLEAGLRRVKRHGTGLFANESWANIGIDVVVGMMGWVVTFVLPLPDAWRLV